eukprot:scaffold181347_cov21-Tisochrysis_lutea.AAC.1
MFTVLCIQSLYSKCHGTRTVASYTSPRRHALDCTQHQTEALVLPPSRKAGSANRTCSSRSNSTTRTSYPQQHHAGASVLSLSRKAGSASCTSPSRNDSTSSTSFSCSPAYSPSPPASTPSPHTWPPPPPPPPCPPACWQGLLLQQLLLLHCLPPPGSTGNPSAWAGGTQWAGSTDCHLGLAIPGFAAAAAAAGRQLHLTPASTCVYVVKSSAEYHVRSNTHHYRPSIATSAAYHRGICTSNAPF